MNCLEIRGLKVSVAGKQIFESLNLTVPAGAVHAVMGPNGAGKSTLAAVLMGHPAFVVEAGTIAFLGQNLLAMDTTARARAGIFLAFQHPISVPGLKVSEYLKALHGLHHGGELGAKEFRKLVVERLAQVDLPRSVLTRDLNEGFSGGEKKRFELLQLALVEPKLVILDEIDSGLDVDALACVKNVIDAVRAGGATVVIISHYKRLVESLNPEVAHVLLDGHIIESGGMELVNAIDAKGYASHRAGAVP